jgi:hypothetical protein
MPTQIQRPFVEMAPLGLDALRGDAGRLSGASGRLDRIARKKTQQGRKTTA